MSPAINIYIYIYIICSKKKLKLKFCLIVQLYLYFSVFILSIYMIKKKSFTIHVSIQKINDLPEQCQLQVSSLWLLFSLHFSIRLQLFRIGKSLFRQYHRQYPKLLPFERTHIKRSRYSFALIYNTTADNRCNVLQESVPI